MSRLAAAAVALTASAVLTGCAEDANDVTCGEFAAMSTDERRIVVRDLAQANETEDELAELGEGDRGVDLAALGIAQRCEGEEDDATISGVFAPDDPTTP